MTLYSTDPTLCTLEYVKTLYLFEMEEEISSLESQSTLTKIIKKQALKLVIITNGDQVKRSRKRNMDMQDN